MINFLIDKLIDRAKRTPFFNLPGYMERYWLVPYPPREGGSPHHAEGVNGIVRLSPWRRPFGWLLQRLSMGVRLHHILRSDDDRAYHDHPWYFVSIILRGGYWEHRPVFRGTHYVGDSRKWVKPGRIVIRCHTSLHRLELPAGQTAWTIFITFRYRHGWGFVPDPRTGVKVPYKQYLQEA